MRGISPIQRNTTLWFRPDIGECFWSQQARRLMIPSPSSYSAYQSISLSGAHYFDKDISRATVKLKYSITSAATINFWNIIARLLLLSLYKSTYWKARKPKREKNICCWQWRGGWLSLCRLHLPLSQSKGHRDLSLLFAELGKKLVDIF